MPGAASQLSLAPNSEPVGKAGERWKLEGEDERQRDLPPGAEGQLHILTSGWSVMFMIKRLGDREKGDKKSQEQLPPL